MFNPVAEAERAKGARPAGRVGCARSESVRAEGLGSHAAPAGCLCNVSLKRRKLSSVHSVRENRLQAGLGPQDEDAQAGRRSRAAPAFAV